MRSLALAAIAILIVGAAAARASDPPGQLRVQGGVVDNGSVYVEGAYQYVSVRRARDGKLLLTRRGVSFLRRLAPGYYRLASWTRSCAGTCATLDSPSNGCTAQFRVRSGRIVTATVATRVGEPCRVEFSAAARGVGT